MNEGLIEAFRHNGWATKELLSFCGALTPDQLEKSGTGTYGTILDTFNHLIGADARYNIRLNGGDPATATDLEPSTDLELLAMRVDETLLA